MCKYQDDLWYETLKELPKHLGLFFSIKFLNIWNFFCGCQKRRKDRIAWPEQTSYHWIRRECKLSVVSLQSRWLRHIDWVDVNLLLMKTLSSWEWRNSFKTTGISRTFVAHLLKVSVERSDVELYSHGRLKNIHIIFCYSMQLLASPLYLQENMSYNKQFPNIYWK